MTESSPASKKNMKLGLAVVLALAAVAVIARSLLMSDAGPGLDAKEQEAASAVVREMNQAEQKAAEQNAGVIEAETQAPDTSKATQGIQRKID